VGEYGYELSDPLWFLLRVLVFLALMLALRWLVLLNPLLVGAAARANTMSAVGVQRLIATPAYWALNRINRTEIRRTKLAIKYFA
jgi:hypothetical protein